MYCKDCGTKNEKDAKFCSKCGKSLTDDSKQATKENENVTPVTINSTEDAGGIRKAMKKDAKGRVNGHLIGATAIYLVVYVLINNVFNSSTTVVNGANTNISISTTSALTSLLAIIISIVFAYGLILVCFKAVKGENFEFSEVFLKPFENIKALGYALLLMVIVCAASFVLAIIPILGWIALIILYFYYLPVISTFLILLADPKTSKDISFTEAFKKSSEIVKGNRVEYYGVAFSFIGWILLSLLTFGILLIWLVPYMELTYVNLYNKWTKEKSFSATETGLSNGTIVGLTAGGCGCGCLVFVVIMAVAASALVAFIGGNINNPQIKSFIDKYAHSSNIDEGQLENDVNDFFNNYNSGYNS